MDSLFSILYSCVSYVFCVPPNCFGDLLAGSLDEEGIGSVVVASFEVALTMCVTVKANALKEERVRGRNVCADLQTGFVMWYTHW